jgi:hypothetical protein
MNWKKSMHSISVLPAEGRPSQHLMNPDKNLSLLRLFFVIVSEFLKLVGAWLMALYQVEKPSLW